MEQVRARGEAEISRIAELQRGCIHRRQLLAAGVGRGGIAYRLAAGTLHPLHRDVYLVGRPRIEPLGLETAAILHFNGFALLSHDSAARVWGIGEVREPAEVTVTSIGRGGRSRPGLRVHRVTALHPSDIRYHRGLPVTSPACTLVGRAAVLDDPIELENDLAQFRRRLGLTNAEILAAIDRAPRNHAGVGRLRRLIRSPESAADTRSRCERRLLRMLRAARLRLPMTNVIVEGHLVDMVWRQERLVLEFDGFASHGGRAAFETDRDRDGDLVAAGYRVIRVTARMLEHEPYLVVARIAAALARSG